MKKISILVSFCFLLFAGAYAQQTPQGMQYQAVARDLGGKILPNQEIALKISLVNNEKFPNIFYSEVHNVSTNSLGLFTLVIGGGKVAEGKFADIPWSTQDIWMQVAIKDKGKSDFAIISNSKLLAVPYAFHAATASQLVGIARNTNARTDDPTPGVPANVWSLQGNRTSDPTKDKLGTTDSTDLVIVTNNLERLRILANGDIIIKRTLTVGANLNVDSSVFLNRKGGSTTNFGPFTVGTSTRRSPTVLKGSLTVDTGQATKLGGTLSVDSATDLNASLNVDGPTNLNSTLNVNNNSATKLTGTLQVNGITNLNSALNVNNGSPTILSGSVRVDSNATFKQFVRIDNPAYNSTSATTGALVVSGGVGIGKNLNVGGDANFGGKTSFAGAVTISDLTQSFNTGTGALIVGGGVGIGKRINVGGGGFFDSTLRVTGATSLNNTLAVTGATTLGNTLAVTGATTLNNTLGVTGATTLGNTLAVTGATTLSNTLGVNGIATINNTTQSSSATDGAFIVAGGIGVAKNVNVGGNLTTTGATTFNGTLSVNGAGTLPGNYIAEFKNTNATNGIRIQVGKPVPDNDNNFITFTNSSGTTVGRIEGETVPELEANPDYQAQIRSYDFDIATGATDVAIATAELVFAGVEVVGAATSTTVCAGLGVCVTAPIPSLIVVAGLKVVLAAATLASEAASLAGFVQTKDQFVSSKQAQIGVTYQSGAGDYAEWLPKANLSEKFLPGQIVAVKDGHITLNTAGASQLLVISSKPIVLGNMPEDGDKKDYEKVAFMGQVPVHVLGKVNRGDYILTAGKHNGLGIAVAPEKMKLEDYNKIVGIAWTSSSNNAFNKINVAVGLNTNDLSKVVVEQNERIKVQGAEISAIRQQMNEINAMVAKLIPGAKVVEGVSATTGTTNTTTLKNAPVVETGHKDIQTVAEAENNVLYYEVTRTQIDEMFDMAEKMFVENGGKYETHPFWKRVRSESGYKEHIKQQLALRFKKAIHTHKDLNKSYSH